MSEEVKQEAGLDKAMMVTADVYSTMDALEVASSDRPQPSEIWGGLKIAPNQMMEIIGGSGLGKSRLALNLAFNQVLGRKFGGLPTYPEPLTWLFYGNENSFSRFQDDIQAMLTTVDTDAERDRLKGHIYLPTMDAPADADISFSAEKNVDKLKATIISRNADVVVMDPWGAFMAGNELSDEDVRKTLNMITQLLAQCGEKLGHPVVAIILNHARNGLDENINCCGFEAANYGRNSKAIFGVMRVVWNLRRYEYRDKDDGELKCGVEFYHAKYSDGETYEAFAVEMDRESHTYKHIPGFEHDVFQRTLEKMKAEHKTSFAGSSENDNRKIMERVVEYLEQRPEFYVDMGTFDNILTAEFLIATNKRNGFKSKMRNEKMISVLKRGPSKYVGLPNRIKEFLKAMPPTEAEKYKYEVDALKVS